MFTKEEPKAITWLKLPASTNDSSWFQNPNQKFETDYGRWFVSDFREWNVKTLELKHKNETLDLSQSVLLNLFRPQASQQWIPGGAYVATSMSHFEQVRRQALSIGPVICSDLLWGYWELLVCCEPPEVRGCLKTSLVEVHFHKGPLYGFY